MKTKTKAPQFDLPGQENAFNLAGEILKQPAAKEPPRVDTLTGDLFETPKCGFQFAGFMPPCVLKPDHEGDHQDGFGGHYGRMEGMKLEQVPGSKEVRYVKE